MQTKVITYTGRHFYRTENEIWAGFGPVGKIEKKRRFQPKCFLFCTGLYTPGFEIDFSTEFVMGHSSGAHITTNYMKLGCHNIKGMILISPVDGVDPFGLIEDFCITPGEKLPFTTPTLIITAGRLLEG